MIKKLRRKFIIAAVLSILAVLVVILTLVNVVNYIRIVSDGDEALKIIAENGGTFPRMTDERAGADENGNIPPEPDSEENGQKPDDLPVIDKKRDDFGIKDVFSSPESEYETRFFTVRFKEGEPLSADIGKIAAVDSKTAFEYGQEVIESGKKSGFIGAYRFFATSEEDSDLVVFLDLGRKLDDLRSTVIATVSVGIIGVFAVTVLVVIFSAQIIKPISESYEKQKRFITDAGHEIKTPIAIINADKEVLEAESGENEWLDDIGLQTKRLTELTSDLIYLSKMDEEAAKFPRCDFSLSDTVLDICDSFKGRAAAEDKKLNLNIAEGIVINGEKKTVERLISVLTDNAFKYSPAGGEIGVTLNDGGKNANLIVENNSENDPGKEKIKHLFDRFYRPDDSRNSEQGGHGIGLSIAKAVTDAHHGKIGAEYKNGKMVFTVSLPKTIK